QKICRGRHRVFLPVLSLRLRPETRCPLPILCRFLPVTRHPVLAGRRSPPGTADPEEVLALVVPGPVAANPIHIPLRFLLGRHLIERRGRSFGDWLGR